MACDYCKGIKNLHSYDIGKKEIKNTEYNESVGIEVYIDANELIIDCVANTFEPNFTDAEILINFCPMCGQKLTIFHEEG